MSSPSEFEAGFDSDSDSDVDFEPDRKPRSSSRRATTSLEPKGLLRKSLSRAQSDSIPASEVNENDPDTGNRFEQLDARLQNLPTQSLDAYSQLLAETEKDFASNSVNETEEPYLVTQNGAVVWTPTEKGTLFNVLDRKGKNGVRELAAAIGTKSELEVSDYLKLLHRGLVGQHVLERHIRTIVMGDIPAATELSEECCTQLDEYAAVLSMKEEYHTERASRFKYANNHLLTLQQAQKLIPKEKLIEVEVENPDEIAEPESKKVWVAEAIPPQRGSIHLAANILNTPMWVELSERLFMNFGGAKEESNWVNVAPSKDDTPALTGDTLMDFYALTMTITRRLVQSTIFFAMSRLRGVGRERINAIRRRDVRAAIDVLNMKHDRSGFMLDVVRRNGLTITNNHANDPKGAKTKIINFDEAEEILGANVNLSSESEDEDEDTDSDDDPEDFNIDSSPIKTHRKHQRQSSTEISSDDPFHPEEDHADTLDRELSRREELKLWSMMGKRAPASLEVPILSEEDEKDAAARKPTIERKNKEELVDWRDRTLYRSEWEEYGAGREKLEEKLAGNMRKRRRIEGERNLIHPSAYRDESPDAVRRKKPSPLSAETVHSSDDETGDEGHMDVD
ncbi:hypothetical protein N7495_000923 [Penicillium taxi]|uniref:uncharacterized protein n=1 Tax=Penicillium taxi TaxID=168475 RepID=UPI0025450564|nr:uncharacterized protein N7495_000923 [Penicillium taxi]KAJ5908241.1 hypothetical protein N7495_000923 [Penicillium taxi]